MKKKNALRSDKDSTGEINAGRAYRAPRSGRGISLAALRKRAEKKLEEQIDRLEELSRQDIEKLVEELGTYQIKLEMQNEELLRTQVALEESRHRYSDLYDFAPIGYFTVDPQGVIRSANLPGAALLGKSRRELTGRPFILFVRKKDRDIFYQYMTKLLEKGGRQSCELRLTGREGEVFHGRLESAAVKDYHGDVKEIRIAVSDITARRQAEETLARERALLEAVMNVTDVMLAYLDAEFNFVWSIPPMPRAATSGRRN